ncbi:MAG TPA: hypothetical protein VHF25_09125 [Nitriliruptorales bacterium]|nr:hypothetical protein [Nitriliruptorales bacterium]
MSTARRGRSRIGRRRLLHRGGCLRGDVAVGGVLDVAEMFIASRALLGLAGATARRRR